MIETMDAYDQMHATYVQLISYVTPQQWAVAAVFAMAVLIYALCD